MAMANAQVTGSQQPDLKRPGLGAARFLLVTMGGASLTFSIYHAYQAGHSGHQKAALPWILAVLAGAVPVVGAVVASHMVAEVKGGRMEISAAVAAMLIAMALSMDATASVVRPIFGPIFCWFLPNAMDVMSMAALRVILKYAAAAHAAAELAAAAPGTTPPGTAAVTGNRAAGSAGSGNQHGGGSGAAGLVPAAGSRNQAAGAARAAGEPGAGAGNHASPAAGGGAKAGPAVEAGDQRAAQPAPRAPRSPAASVAPEVRPERPELESRDEVTAEMTGRAKPALESSATREQRALDILAEFRARTGQRMNNTELAKALGMRKADVGPVRAAIQDREESAA